MSGSAWSPFKFADMFTDGNVVIVTRFSQYRKRNIGCCGETQATFITFPELPGVLRGDRGPSEFILRGA